MRSSVEGCVENSRMMLCAGERLDDEHVGGGGRSVHGDALGPGFELLQRRRSAGRASRCTWRVAASASYSREREIAIWISMAAMGARIIMAIAADRRCRGRRRRGCPPNQNAMRARNVMAAGDAWRPPS